MRATYGIRHLNVMLSLANVFSHGTHERNVFDTNGHFAYRSWQTGDFNPYVMVKVSYTFTYGKKVVDNAGEMESGGSRTGSAILK